MAKKPTSKLSLRWLYLAWVSVMVAVVGIGIIGAIAQGDPGPFITDKLGFGEIGIFALGLHSIGMGLTVWLLGRKLKQSRLSWGNVGLRGRITSDSGLYAILAAVVAFFLFPVVEYVIRGIGLTMYWGGANNLNVQSAQDIIVLIAGPVILAPLFEEIIFRGYVLNAFLAKYSRGTAILLSTLVFTSAHIFFGLGLMVYIFFWALTATHLYLKYKSLYPVLLFHVINNALAYVALPLLDI